MPAAGAAGQGERGERSGLGRVARLRSDAPRLTEPFGTPLTIFGTIGITSAGNTTGTIVGVTIKGSAGIAGWVTVASDSIGAADWT